MADGRVLIAPGNPLAASPSWTRYDTLDGCRVNGIEINSGRQSEFDVTDTGAATVFFHDQVEAVNDVDLVGLAVQLQVQNPVTSAWVPQFRGVVDDFTYDVDPSGVVSNVQMECVDMFDYLAGVEMIPDAFGVPPPAGNEDVVFFDDAQPVNERMVSILDDALVDTAMYVVFTGNVKLLETKYDPGDSILIALRDCADAEFPGIANCYVDKIGRFVFHGRYARFTPEGVESSGANWDFTRWKAGDGAAIAVDATRAQIRSFSYNRPRSRIINAAISYPRNGQDGLPFPRTDMLSQIFIDTPSKNAYGYHSWSAQDLIIYGHKTNGNTGIEECQLFAQYYIANYAVPRTSIKSVTFKSVRPDDPRAGATWGLMCGMEISDVIDISVGGTGINAQEFYVEGFHMSIRPHDPGYDMVEVTPNLSPAAYYDTDVF